MKSQILLENIKLNLHIGLTDEERKETQLVLITIRINKNVTNAIVSDKIEDTLNYEEIYDKVLDLEKNSYKLIEKLAGDIQLIILDLGVNKFEIKVTKTPFEKCGDVSLIIASE